MASVDFTIEVPEAVGLGEPARVAVTVTATDEVGSHPVVCFAKPGGGYSRRYFTESLPGPSSGAQADWHAQRGWVFVSVDHLGVGDSSILRDSERLSYTPVVAASHHAEREVLRRLAEGSLVDGLGPIREPTTVGIGQSMGGCLTVVQQGRYHSYDGIAVLGYSAVHTHPPVRPGTPPIVVPWLPRDVVPSQGVFTNGPALTEAGAQPVPGPEAMAWGFYYDDVDPVVVDRDLDDFPGRRGSLPPWASATVPPTIQLWCLTPGAIAAEAAAVRVPVLIAVGERDVVADPRGEPRAYLSTNAVDLFICPRMGHMHNFAGTRHLLWRRLEGWAHWVQAVRPARR